MTVIEKAPVPIYEATCYECKSKIQYKKSEVFTSHIQCPVCGILVWADTIQPVRYEGDQAMTLEDAIRHAEEVAKEKEEASKRWKECKDSQTIEWSKLYFDSVEEIIEKCDKYATEHRQLAEWLRELKERREKDGYS